jgi:NurA-like 5'-3' nuclease
VTRLLHLAHTLVGDTKKGELPNPLELLADRAIFATLPAGARSALFISPKEINAQYYAPRGHEAHFFYVNLAEAGSEPVIARVEVPAWVARDDRKLDTIHAVVVAQARITGDYPYVLARADELAYVSGRERAALENMVVSSLINAGVETSLSPKAHYKRLTRQGF